MTTDDLRQRIAELQRELENASKTDIHVKDMLGSLMEDIVVIASGEEKEDVEAETVKNQLEQQATDFETRHPKLAGIMRHIMDLLGKMGI